MLAERLLIRHDGKPQGQNIKSKRNGPLSWIQIMAVLK
jgi:hypothetical protein